MKSIIISLILCLIIVTNVVAGDDASGHIPYKIDLSNPFETYKMTEKDRMWSESLVKNLKYKKAVVHFVKTTLSLKSQSTGTEEYPQISY